MRKFLVAAVISLSLVGSAVAQSVTDAQLLSGGLGQEAPNGDSRGLSISPNGKALAFASDANNLVAADVNGFSDIFTVSEVEGLAIPKLLVTSADGGFPDGGSNYPVVSAIHPDGKRFAVSFLSTAHNLIDGYEPINEIPQVFVSLQPRGDNILVSRALGSRSPGNLDLRPSNGVAFSTSIAVKGIEPPELRVAFISCATDLGPDAENPNGKMLPFMAAITKRDGRPGWAVRIRRIPTPDLNTDVQNLVLSGDGDIVAYDVARPTVNGGALRQVYRVRDRSTQPELVTAYGLDNGFESFEPSLSFDGKVISFLTRSQMGSVSAAPNLFFVRTGDDFAQRPTQANTNSSGVASDGNIIDFGDYYPTGRLAPNGFLISFSDSGSNLADNGGSPPSFSQTYVKNLLTNEIVRTSALANKGVRLAEGGQSYTVGLGGAFYGSNSMTATFVSRANNLSDHVGVEPYANAYRSVLTFSPPPLSPNFPINAPPHVSVNGDSVTIRLQDFSATLPTSSKGPSIQAGKVRYVVEITNSTTRKRIRLVTTRNRVTVRKLSPGRYTVRYRATSTPSGGSVVRSKYSPKQPMTISS